MMEKLQKGKENKKKIKTHTLTKIMEKRQKGKENKGKARRN